VADLELIIGGERDGPRLVLRRYRREGAAGGGDLLHLSARLEVGAALVASTGVETLEGDGLPEWARGLAEDWRGWCGERIWRSLEDDMIIKASHDGRGHVALRVTLRGPKGYLPDAWHASATVRLDAGEEMTGLAAAVRAFFSEDRRP
jgi:hypothetical protein